MKRLFFLCACLFSAAIFTFEVKIFRQLSGNSSQQPFMPKNIRTNDGGHPNLPSSRVVMAKTHDFNRLGFYKNKNEAHHNSSVHQPVVPKLVHLTWFHKPQTKLRFHQMISILSIDLFIKPNKIIFWCNNQPVGTWWLFVRKRVTNIVIVYRQPPGEIFGHPISVPEHQSDVVRIEVLIQYGGIYVDLDVIALKSFDPLLVYNTTMGAESMTHLGSGIILSIPNSKFLKIWLDSYKTFDDKKWAHHSVVIPMRIARTYPDLVHIEWDTMHRPNWMERAWLYSDGKLWDWFSNYAIHLWYRYHDVEHNAEDIKYLNTTMGEIFRYVFYGSYEIWPR